MCLTSERICELYDRGYSVAGIAKMDGRSEGTVRNRLLDAGRHLRTRSEANQLFPTETAVRLYNLGLSVSQIGELLGVHSTTVVKRFQTIGFPLRPNEVAAGLGYSTEEMRTFFLTDVFLDVLSEVAA